MDVQVPAYAGLQRVKRLGDHPRGRARLPSGLHRGSDRACRHPARRADGPRNDDGVGVRGDGHLLRRPARRRRGGDGRHHRVVDDGDLCRGDRSLDRRDGDGGATNRREGPRWGGARRGAVARARPCRCARHRRNGRDLRSGSAARHGGERRRHSHRFRVRARHAGHERDRAAAVSDQLDFSRRGRRGDCHARALVRECHQHHARSVSRLRDRPVSAPGRGRCRHCDQHRPRLGRTLPAVSPDPRRPSGRRTRCGTFGRIPTSWPASCACPASACFRTSSPPRRGWD